MQWVRSALCKPLRLAVDGLAGFGREENTIHTGALAGDKQCDGGNVLAIVLPVRITLVVALGFGLMVLGRALHNVLRGGVLRGLCGEEEVAWMTTKLIDCDKDVFTENMDEEGTYAHCHPDRAPVAEGVKARVLRCAQSEASDLVLYQLWYR